MFEINEEPPRSDCHVQNHAADARERHHSPRMAQYGRLGRNHRGAWAPMRLPRGAVRPNGQRAAPRRPHRIRRLAGMPRPRTQTDHSGRTQKIHPLMRLVPGAKNNASGHSPRFARTPTPRPRPTCACCSNGMDSPSQSSTSRSRRRAMPRTVPQFRTACGRPNLASLSLGSCAATAHCAVA